MTRSRRASSRNRRSRSRAAQTPQAPIGPTPQPPVVHQLRADNYTLSAPEFGQPEVDQAWLEKNLTEWLVLALRIHHHFASEEKRAGQRVLEKDGVPYIMKCEPPPGREMSKHLAEVLFTICREASRMSGGRPPGKKND